MTDATGTSALPSPGEDIDETARQVARIDAGLLRTPAAAPSWLFGTDGAQVRLDALARIAARRGRGEPA